MRVLDWVIRIIVILGGVLMWYVGFHSRPYPAFGGEGILFMLCMAWVCYDLWERR